MVRHIDALGILFVVWGLLQLMLGLTLTAIYVLGGAAMGVVGGSGGDEEMMVVGGFMGGIGLIVGCSVLVFAVPNLVVGMGIRRRDKWARIGGLVLGALALPSFPFGTGLGIYALLVLVDHEVGSVFEKGQVDE